MSEITLYPVTDRACKNAQIDKDQYHAMYRQSIEDPDTFWKTQAQRIQWQKPFTRVKNTSFDKNDLFIRWFEDGELNVTESCLDRHLTHSANKPAIIWEPDHEGNATRTLTYQQLADDVFALANGLKSLGVCKGDVVTIYMPMVPEITIAMLACARIGAIHSVVFGGFSPEAIAGRIEDGNSRIVITADEGLRAGRAVHLKTNVDKAIEHCNPNQVDHVIVLTHTGGTCSKITGRDVDYQQLIKTHHGFCPAERMNAEDPLFILYTSGSTGKPKGVMHTSGGYLVYASLTHQYVFDYQPNDTYWCMADIGWITGHSYAVYGPLSNAATCIMYEGVPNHPDAGRMARIIDKYQVNIVYTAPTAIRALMSHGDEAIENTQLTSLKLLATAGEPINPEAWRWFHEKFGKGQCPIMDTWWQTV